MAQQSQHSETSTEGNGSEESWGTTADSLLTRFGTTEEDREAIHTTRLRLHNDKELYRWAIESAKACELKTKEFLTATAILIVEGRGNMDALLLELQHLTKRTPVKFIEVELETLKAKLNDLLKMVEQREPPQ